MDGVDGGGVLGAEGGRAARVESGEVRVEEGGIAGVEGGMTVSPSTAGSSVVDSKLDCVFISRRRASAEKR